MLIYQNKEKEIYKNKEMVRELTKMTDSRYYEETVSFFKSILELKIYKEAMIKMFEIDEI